MSVGRHQPRAALRRLLTAPLSAIVLLGGLTSALIVNGNLPWALATVAAAGGVSLSGSV